MRGWRSALLLGVLALATRPASGADKESESAHLGLNEAQEAKLKAIGDEQRKDAEPLRDELKIAVEKLRWQYDAKADGKDLSATLAEIEKVRRTLEDLHEKSEQKIAGLLTPEQRAKRFLLGPGSRPMRTGGDSERVSRRAGDRERDRDRDRERDGSDRAERPSPPEGRGGGDGPADAGGDGPP